MNLTRVILLITLITAAQSAVQAREFAQVKPEKLGVSSERIKKIETLVDGYVNQQQYSGVVTLLARDGKIVHQYAAGTFGVDDNKPLAVDSLFRIYSMTKPITAVAAMMLYEEGKFHLDDPIAKYLPEFAEQKVWHDGELKAPKRAITIRHLLTHTAGMSYGWTDDNPVDLQYQQAQLFDSQDLNQFITKLAAIPLRFEPGTRYHYSVSYDVLGALIERLSGQSLDAFFKQRIFLPLAMQDTYFQVPKDQSHRLAADQSWDYSSKQIVSVPAEQRRRFDKVNLFMGGGGLVSSAHDYLRFCQMVLNGGQLDGRRILSPKTVQLMSANQLSPEVRAQGVGQYPALDLYQGQSMSLGFGVVTDPAAMPDLSSLGELSWGGVAGTKFWIDPQEKLIGIALVQLYQSPWRLRADFKTASYQALDRLYKPR